MTNKKLEMIGAVEASEMLGCGDGMFRIYARTGKFKTAKKVRGTTWMVSKMEIEGIMDGTIKVDFTGAMGQVYGKSK